MLIRKPDPPRPPTRELEAPGGVAVAAAPPEGLDTDALRRLAELDPTGANRLLERVFQAFETSVLRLMPQLHVALAGSDHATVRHVAHTLKSSSASIGAIKLSRLCAEIETMVRLQSLEGLAERAAEMDRETAVVLQALKRITDVPT